MKIAGLEPSTNLFPPKCDLRILEQRRSRSVKTKWHPVGQRRRRGSTTMWWRSIPFFSKTSFQEFITLHTSTPQVFLDRQWFQLHEIQAGIWICYSWKMESLGSYLKRCFQVHATSGKVGRGPERVSVEVFFLTADPEKVVEERRGHIRWNQNILGRPKQTHACVIRFIRLIKIVQLNSSRVEYLSPGSTQYRRASRACSTSSSSAMSSKLVCSTSTRESSLPKPLPSCLYIKKEKKSWAQWNKVIHQDCPTFII